MEGSDGGLHPAVEGHSLGTKYKGLMTFSTLEVQFWFIKSLIMYKIGSICNIISMNYIIFSS